MLYLNMIIKAIYKINESYVIGDDKGVYRLPWSNYRRSFGLRKIKPYRGGYFISGEFILKEDIKFESIEPYVLIDTTKLPF